MNRLRPVPLSIGFGLTALVYGVLAWFHFVPGGWTLKALVEDPGKRKARLQREASDERMAAFARERPTLADGAIVFIGSSTIERFPLEDAFPHVATVDRGIGNETAVECLARLELSLPPIQPAGIVVYLASLDFRREHQPAPAVVRRVGRVLDAVEAHWPGIPVAQIGLLSEQDADAGFVERWRRINRALREAAEARGIAFVSVDRPPLTSPSGQLAESMSSDRLHLNAAGYRHLADWLVADGGALGALLRP